MWNWDRCRHDYTHPPPYFGARILVFIRLQSDSILGGALRVYVDIHIFGLYFPFPPFRKVVFDSAHSKGRQHLGSSLGSYSCLRYHRCLFERKFGFMPYLNSIPTIKSYLNIPSKVPKFACRFVFRNVERYLKPKRICKLSQVPPIFDQIPR